MEKIKRGEESIWNLPNALTGLRIFLAPVIVLLLLKENRFKNRLAALAVGAAALTDFLDGHLARKHGQETRLGEFMDPLADKVIISASFVILAVRKRVPGWAPGIIIGREAAITLFRIYAGARGASVPASIWGKLKMNSQLFALVLSILDDDGTSHEDIKKAALVLTVILTLYSGLDYLIKAGKYLDTSEES